MLRTKITCVVSIFVLALELCLLTVSVDAGKRKREDPGPPSKHGWCIGDHKKNAPVATQSGLRFEGIARAVLQNFTPRSMQPTYRGARTKRSSVPFAKNILNCLVLEFVNRVFPQGFARLAVTSIHGSMQHIAKYAQQFERSLELSNDVLLYGARSVVR